MSREKRALGTLSYCQGLAISAANYHLHSLSSGAPTDLSSGAPTDQDHLKRGANSLMACHIHLTPGIGGYIAFYLSVTQTPPICLDQVG